MLRAAVVGECQIQAIRKDQGPLLKKNGYYIYDSLGLQNRVPLLHTKIQTPRPFFPMELNGLDLVTTFISIEQNIAVGKNPFNCSFKQNTLIYLQ